MQNSGAFVGIQYTKQSSVVLNTTIFVVFINNKYVVCILSVQLVL